MTTKLDRRSFTSLQITDVLIAASVPAIAYICVFSFEAGYAEYFSIPKDLITIETNRILRYMLPLAPLALGALLVIDVVSTKVPSDGSSSMKFVIPNVFLLLVGVMAMILLAPVDNRWLVISLGILLYFSLQTFAIFRQKSRESNLASKFRARVEHLSKRPTLLGRLLGLPGHSASVLVLSLVLVVWACFDTGYWSGAMKTDFYTFGPSQETAVLRIYRDRAILANWEEHDGSRRVDCEKRIISLEEIKFLTLRPHLIGPLQPCN